MAKPKIKIDSNYSLELAFTFVYILWKCDSIHVDQYNHAHATLEENFGDNYLLCNECCEEKHECSCSKYNVDDDRSDYLYEQWRDQQLENRDD